MPPERSRILQLAWLPRRQPGRASCGPSFLAGLEGRERAQWFLEAPAGIRLGAAWVCVCQVGGAGRRRRWLRSERFAPGCRGTRSSGVSDGSPGVPPLCVWTCASSGRSPMGRRDMQKPSQQRLQFQNQPLEGSARQPQPWSSGGPWHGF